MFRYKRGTEIKKKAILSLESYQNPTSDLNDLSNGSMEPNVLLVETRGVEPLTSAMPLQRSAKLSYVPEFTALQTQEQCMTLAK